jgi:hypothetical protein
MKVEVNKKLLTKIFQKDINKCLESLKEYAEKWYLDEEIPDWMSSNIVEWVDSVEKVTITNLQVRKDDIGNNFYITVDAVLNSAMRFDIDEILQHISYMMMTRMFGFRSGNQIIMISDNINLNNTNSDWY